MIELFWPLSKSWFTKTMQKRLLSSSTINFVSIMATNPKSKKRRNSSFAEARQGVTQPAKTTSPMAPRQQGPRWFLIGLFVVIVFGGGALAMVFKDMKMFNYAMASIDQCKYKIVAEYPHDPLAFTQGLFFHDGRLYESTGRYGESTMRIVDLETGEVTTRIFLGEKRFGEGADEHKGKIYQLTWKEEECLVYDLDLKDPPEKIKYEGEGWGLCSDGEHLIMTDGGSRLMFVDPEDWSVKKKITVRTGNRPVSALNELEYAEGKIFANQLGEDVIFEIDPESGQVTTVIDLKGLWPLEERPQGGVLNGIAYDEENEKMYVTGKYCPKMFEIEFVPKGRNEL